jgi:hypothetical protein
LTAVPWNAAWDAEVQSEAADALNAYDPPTKAELDAAVDALPTAAENAEEVLKHDWDGMTGEASRSLLNAGRFLRNKWDVAAGTLTVKKENDSTTAWTAAVSSDASANPIIGSDPA